MSIIIIILFPSSPPCLLPVFPPSFPSLFFTLSFFPTLSTYSLYLFKFACIEIHKKDTSRYVTHPPRKDAKREDRLCLVETGLQQRTRSTRWDCRRFSSPHHNKLCRGPHKNHLVLISLIVERFFHRELSRLCERNQNKPTERSILEAV